MSKDVYIFEITEKSFPSSVIENSHKLPVVVAFMGAWSEPCFIVADIFSSLAKEFSGQFIFAKVDIDEQQELRKRYQIENVPSVLVFNQGEIERVEVGQLDDVAARVLLREFGIFHESDDLREQARTKHLDGDTAGAIVLLSKAIEIHPTNTRVAMDMVQIFIDIGELESAQGLFAKLPETDRGSDVGKSLSSQLTFNEYAAKTDGVETLQARVLSNPDDAQTRFDLAVCFMAVHDYKSAMDHLFDILKTTPDFKEGAAKEMIMTVIKMLAAKNPELAKEYQRRLSSQILQ